MIVSFAAARAGCHAKIGARWHCLASARAAAKETRKLKDDNSALDLRMFTSGDYEFTLELQLYLFAEATLGTEESGHCREVEAKVNVWTVRQKNGHCREVEAKVNVWTVRQKNGHCREVEAKVNVWTVRQKNGHCREVEAKVNVWTVRQKNGHCREAAVVGGSTVHRIIFTCYFYLHFSSGLHRKQ